MGSSDPLFHIENEDETYPIISTVLNGKPIDPSDCLSATTSHYRADMNKR